MRDGINFVNKGAQRTEGRLQSIICCCLGYRLQWAVMKMAEREERKTETKPERDLQEKMS